MFRDGSRVIHIGLPKTGTSSLQASLDAARASLEEQGVSYAASGRHQLAAVKAGLGTLEAWRNQDRRLAEWDELAARVRTSASRLTLLSSEGFSGAPRDAVPRIVRELGDNLEIVVTLRPLAPLMASMWQQELYLRETASLEDWLRHRLSAKGGPYELVMHRYALPRIVNDWAPSVGEAALTFVIADPAEHSSTNRHFESLLGLRDGTLPQPPSANASLPYAAAELLRHFGLTYSARGGRDAPWLRAIRSKARFGFAELPLPSQPIVLPRWAAERCNELTSEWLAAVSGTDVHIVGNPDHLYVDPATHPASIDEPTSIDVEAAGAMLDVVFDAARSLAGKPATPSLDSVSTRELLRELRRRTSILTK